MEVKKTKTFPMWKSKKADASQGLDHFLENHADFFRQLSVRRLGEGPAVGGKQLIGYEKTSDK